MNKLLLILLIPLSIFSQETTIIGDVDCDGIISSEDASLILQFVTNMIEALPCEANMIGLTPEQLQEIINMMNSQLNTSSEETPITMIGPMYLHNEFPDFIDLYEDDNSTLYYLDAIRFCAQLSYDGYDDWFLPSANQIQNFIINENQIIIPNYVGGAVYYMLKATEFNGDYHSIYFNEFDGVGTPFYFYEISYIQQYGECFCVR